ncbi:hypothetical protein [Nocardia rhizosphaerae]|uniref:Uncharacterized protein n=1 Tax=Nocardia rhizosphaerae TaxID=1691571 RepID=A0ABV8L6A6_9NOCA
MEVWDTVVLTLPTEKTGIALRFIPETAVLHTPGKANGRKLDIAELGTDGALLGCDELDGELEGTACYRTVSFDFVADQPRFTAENWISDPDRNTEPKIRADVKPESVVTVKAKYKNTGSVQQNDVLFRFDALPRCTSLVPGSVEVATSATDGKWERVASTRQLLNLGAFAPDGTAYLKFQLKVCDRPSLEATYPHNWEKGRLFLSPNLQVKVDTQNGSISGQPLSIAVLGPNQ